MNSAARLVDKMSAADRWRVLRLIAEKSPSLVMTAIQQTRDLQDMPVTLRIVPPPPEEAAEDPDPSAAAG